MILSILLDQLPTSTNHAPLLLPEKPHPTNFRKFAPTRHASLPPTAPLFSQQRKRIWGCGDPTHLQHR
ncbi:hypothetical protein NA56DRAFT_641749 [Hyaloscypha hepaticicola]|uniref:Uncharacterized protein n=1 Tax=Hyaloscypha hepaticicola TaxID=2082293 RepID=A0A2J6QJ05_9HELO|nr:hypothetical protein NA56DRAFT_641749 [Hyaloscypha hepaticicola]